MAVLESGQSDNHGITSEVNNSALSSNQEGIICENDCSILAGDDCNIVITQ